jgi:hypothetical protein
MSVHTNAIELHPVLKFLAARRGYFAVRRWCCRSRTRWRSKSCRSSGTRPSRLRAASSPLPAPLPLPASSEHACDPPRESHRYGLALFSPRPHVVGPPDRRRSKPGDRLGEVLSPSPPSGLRSGGAENLGDLGDSGKIVGRSSGRHACEIDTFIDHQAQSFGLTPRVLEVARWSR